MNRDTSRRSVILSIPSAGLAALGLPRLAHAGVRFGAQPPASASPDRAPWPGFPKNDPALVAEVVGAAHRNEPRVRELIDAHPALVNAWWDWGFGDWESPLGASSHVGRRDIAELLISRGARVDIFAAASLGWLDAVRTMIEASPGVERALGPHCITLLAHARAGGERAVPVLEYLKTLPGADAGPAVQVLEPGVLAKYAGAYSFGAGAADRFPIRVEKSGLEFVLADQSARRLHCIAPDQFFPAGVPSVRFTFDAGPASGAAAEKAMGGVTIVDHDLSVRCSRVG